MPERRFSAFITTRIVRILYRIKYESKKEKTMVYMLSRKDALRFARKCIYVINLSIFTGAKTRQRSRRKKNLKTTTGK